MMSDSFWPSAIGEVLAHADGLAALTGKCECDAAHGTILPYNFASPIHI